MLTTIAKRNRKCDTLDPCGMCSTYGYNCRYANDDTTDTTGSGALVPPPAKRVSLSGESRLTNRAPTTRMPGSRCYMEQGSREADGSPMKNPTVVAGASPGIFDEQKVTHSGAPPKTRSFAYNFGIRPEEYLGPIGDFLDPRIYAQRCREYYHTSSSNTVAFAAVAAGAGAAVLGLFLSPNKHPRESDLVQYSKAILDDPASMRLRGIDHIVAWGMRVFYLRATTYPSNAWIVSCTQMHLCEAIGLHEDENIKKMASIAGGHNMLSYEYDRSPVHFRSVTCQSFVPVSGSIADQFVQLIQVIPSSNSLFQLEWLPTAPGSFRTRHPFLVVTKADIAFCFYRRLYQLKIRIPDEVIKLIIDSGSAAVEAAEQQANRARLFWNVIGSVFQYACILLAIDIPAVSVHIGAAFKGLENLVKAADTGLTREALSMARHLLSLNLAKKRKELAQLEAVEANYQFFPAQRASETGTAVPVVDWEVDWDQFFIEPYLSMLGPDIQL
ncbi:C6 zinc finger domain protein [Aspergillus granulosus]|uniref:C6 zinc finger domain protein n=1 Tax=Aspergillus granulosus TaxID=176169 RepID=A0ABR4GTF5_9EURO